MSVVSEHLLLSILTQQVISTASIGLRMSFPAPAHKRPSQVDETSAAQRTLSASVVMLCCLESGCVCLHSIANIR